jgi:hypothetical protein
MNSSTKKETVDGEDGRWEAICSAEHKIKIDDKNISTQMPKESFL